MKKIKSFSLFAVVLVLGLILASCGSSSDSAEGGDGDGKAEKWPHKNTTLVLPFDAGGSLDSMMRVLTKNLEPELDTKFKIDNRPGAATQVGTTAFVNQKR